MRILYFSRAYTPHDYRFLSAMATTAHEIYFLRLERRASETRPVPASVRVVEPYFSAYDGTPAGLLNIMPAFDRVLDDVAPDLIHAGPIQSCAFMAALSRFQPL